VVSDGPRLARKHEIGVKVDARAHPARIPLVDAIAAGARIHRPPPARPAGAAVVFTPPSPGVRGGAFRVSAASASLSA
jgi:hypothetical protein